MALHVDLYRGSGAGARSEIVCGGFALSATHDVMCQFASDLLEFMKTDRAGYVSLTLDADLQTADEDDPDDLPEQDIED